MASPIFFDFARPDEIQPVMSLTQSCIAAMRNRGLDQWDEIYPHQMDFEHDISEGNLYVGKAENGIVACAVLDAVQEPEYATVPWQIFQEPIAVVHRLMVGPPWQGQGIAGRLMDFLENRGRELGYQTIRLDAFISNATAVNFYERRGYRRTGIVQFRKGRFYCFEKSIGGQI